MSAELETSQPLTTSEAERLSIRISLRLDEAAENWNDALGMIREAIDGAAYLALGYRSHGEYVADRFGGSLSKLGIELRREVVRELSDAGLSTRAIAPVVGASFKTVARDLSGVSGDTPATDLEEPQTQDEGLVAAPVEPSPEVPRAATDDLHVNPLTGELTDAPVTTEHTVTEKTRTVIGLDGKSYTPKPRTPKPVLAGESLEKYDAEQAAIAVGRALTTFDAMRTPAHRARVIAWWPAGNDAVPPDSRALFAPAAIRNIAAALLELADDLEVHS